VCVRPKPLAVTSLRSGESVNALIGTYCFTYHRQYSAGLFFIYRHEQYSLANHTEKGEIVVLNSKVCTSKLREEFEVCGHSFALLVYLLGGDLQLSQRAELALFEYGVAQLERFEQAEATLRD
jgi:hypothetical protein